MKSLVWSQVVRARLDIQDKEEICISYLSEAKDSWDSPSKAGVKMGISLGKMDGYIYIYVTICQIFDRRFVLVVDN